MGEPPCTLLQAEMALDLLEAALATELPAHMRAFAQAHAAGRPPPPAPARARAAASLKVARDALAHELLADRGVALMRLLVPLMIDLPVPAERTWASYRAFAAAREQAAQARFGRGALELVHVLAGAADVVPVVAQVPPPVEGWEAADRAVEDAEILELWKLIAERHAIQREITLLRGAPRTFVVEPRREVIVVVPAVVDTPRARTQVLHELGHAVAALTLPGGIARAVDEAAAAHIARLAEPGSWLPARWTSTLAPAARARRLAIAQLLDASERGLASAHLPAVLFEDPGAQAAYVAAEAIADRLDGPGALKAEHDRVTWRACELGLR